MRILLAGGGSGGPVAPLLSVAKKIHSLHKSSNFLLVGTNNGPEQQMAEAANIPFVAIPAGKLRRYFPWATFLAPCLAVAGMYKAYGILKSFRPNCVFAAGSFVQVPVVWMAKFLHIPVVIHQQDLVPGLANKLCQLAADKITVTFPESLKEFSSNLGLLYKKNSDKVVLTGNPFREELADGQIERARKTFGLNSNLPTLLVLGGGTGAEFFNTLISGCLPNLAKTVQIIHVTGKNKTAGAPCENYHSYEFLNGQDLADAYAAANMVLSRAGLSTITELSNLAKMSIIIPMPNSHQEVNAGYVLEKQAAIVLRQSRVTSTGFNSLIRKLLFAQEAKKLLEQNIGDLVLKNATKKIADIIITLSDKHIYGK